MTKPTKPRRTGFYQARDAWTRACILRALVEAKGNQSHAAKLLGISRRTVLNQCEVLGLPTPGMGQCSLRPSEAHRKYMAQLLDEQAKLDPDYAELFKPKPATPTAEGDSGLAAKVVEQGVEIAKLKAELDALLDQAPGSDGLGDAIAARARCLAAKTIELNAKILYRDAEIAKLKQDSIADQMRAQRQVNDMEHAAAAHAQRARGAEAQVRQLTAELAELRLRHIRNRGELDTLAQYRARESLVLDALRRLETRAGAEAGRDQAFEPADCKLVAQIRGWNFAPSPGVMEMEMSATDGGALEVTAYGSAAEFLAEYPPSNRCPAPPEDHSSVSTCCDGAPLFLRPVSGVSAEEVQTMHDERIKEAFAKLGPPEQP